MTRKPSKSRRSTIGDMLGDIPELKQTPDEMRATKEFLNPFRSQSERGFGLVWAAGLDEALTEYIQSVMQEHESEQKEIFRDGGALGNFSTKIKVGYLLGLYNDVIYKNLVFIHKIRNQFAHVQSARDFSHDRVRELARNLSFREITCSLTNPDPRTGIPKDTTELRLAIMALATVMNLAVEANTPQRSYIEAVAYLIMLFRTYAERRVKLTLPAQPEPPP